MSLLSSEHGLSASTRTFAARVPRALRLEREHGGAELVGAVGLVQREGSPVERVAGVAGVWVPLLEPAEQLGRAPVVAAVQRLERGAVERVGRVALQPRGWRRVASMPCRHG